MKFIRCAVHAADAGNGGKNLQVGCVHGNTHTLGVHRKHIAPYLVNRSVDCRRASTVSYAIYSSRPAQRATARETKATLPLHAIPVSQNFVSRCAALSPYLSACSERPPHRS